MSAPLRILAIGAHPDDCDLKFAGTAALYRQANAEVRFVSVTNGQSGHHQLRGQQVVERRRNEALAAGRRLGLRYDVLDFADGFLEATLPTRLHLLRLIREFRPDAIFTHRPWDYHPDHRYTAQMVCDAAYMVTVPNVAPETPFLERNPVIFYFWDRFTRPYPFSACVAVDVDPLRETIIDVLDCHDSQFYEWLPFNRGELATVPTEPADRRVWLTEWYRQRTVRIADQHRDLLQSIYGREHGASVKLAEAFELCEHGSPLPPSERLRLFPFLPAENSDLIV